MNEKWHRFKALVIASTRYNIVYLKLISWQILY